MNRFALCLGLVGSLFVSTAGRGDQQVKFEDVPLKLTANAVNMSNIGTGQTATVDITINRWSADAERERLLAVFLDKGPEQLLSALQDKLPVGRISTPGAIGYDLRYARLTPLDDGGARIVALTDRPISGWEAVHRPRVFDYPFTLIQIQLDAHGNGEGKLSIATKISYDKKAGEIELETYASEPVRLENVHLNR